MKSYISIAAILGAAGVIAVPDHAAIELNTFCVTYLSTYLVPVSQNASLTSGQLTVEPPFLTTVDGTVITLTDEPDFTSNPTDSLTSLTSGEIASSALAPFISESSVQSGSETQTGTETDEPPLLTTIDLGTTTITAVIPTSSGIIEPQGQAVILAVNLENDNQRRSIHKRTLGGFVGPDDPNVCTFASTFNFAEDELFVGGLPVFYSPGDTNKELIGGDNIPGDAVTRGFTIAGGALGFNNADLPGGAASFCQTDDGRVFIVFTDGPPECTPVVLLVYSVIRCQNGRIVGLESSTTSDTATSIIASTQSAVSSSSEFQSQSVAPVSQTTDSEASTAASSDVEEPTASLESTTADAPVSEASTTGTLAETETTDAPSTEAVDSTLVETSTESIEPDTTTAAASDSTSQPTLDSSQLPETVASTDAETTTSDALESTTEPATDTETTTADDTTTEDTTTADETETTAATEATTTEETTAEPATTDTTAGDTTTAAEETTTAAEDTTTAAEDTTTAVSETTTEDSFPEDTTTTVPPILPQTTTTDGFQETTATPLTL